VHHTSPKMSGLRRRETHLDFKTAFEPGSCGKRGDLSLARREAIREVTGA
jgi:hypothetical protein